MLKRKYLSFLKYYYFNKISLCDPDWPTTHSVDYAGLEHQEIHLRLLGLEAYVTIPSQNFVFNELFL